MSSAGCTKAARTIVTHFRIVCCFVFALGSWACSNCSATTLGGCSTFARIFRVRCASYRTLDHLAPSYSVQPLPQHSCMCSCSSVIIARLNLMYIYFYKSYSVLLQLQSFTTHHFSAMSCRLCKLPQMRPRHMSLEHAVICRALIRS